MILPHLVFPDCRGPIHKHFFFFVTESSALSDTFEEGWCGGATTLSITTLSVMTISVMTNDTQYYNEKCDARHIDTQYCRENVTREY